MEDRSKKNEKGLIGIIILIVVALALLKYFLDWSVFEAAATPQGQETVGYTQHVIQTVWSYLDVPFHFIWDRILSPILELIWHTFQNFILFSKNSSRTQ